MKLRDAWVLVLLIALAACGGAAEEPAEEATTPAAEEPAAAEPMMDDAAALDERTEYFVTHYNMHHADMVAALYTEDAMFLGADGSVLEGRAAIEANFTEGMAGEPTLSLDVLDRTILGDNAISLGTWSLETTPEGASESMTLGGHFLNWSVKVDGEWMTSAVVTNYDAEPPAEAPRAEPPAEEPEELTDSPLAELTEYYATHFNMGHGDMVADRYTEDAMAAVANQPLASGRAAIAAQLNERVADGSPQLTIHEVAAEDLGDGWILGGGWYEIATEAGGSAGAYMLLARAGDDGNMQIHRVVSNGQPNQ